MSRAVIIDCDPGVDDGVALLLAFASSADLNLLGITTVAGNVGVDLTTRNACIIREIATRTDVRVFAGCDRPLVRAPVEAGHFHGATGLGGLPVFAPRTAHEPLHAVRFLIDSVLTAPAGSITVVTMGPMTNVALALRAEPRLAERIGSIVVMGGARREGGNITASAEYNVYADPHAAQTVFASGCKIVVLGLDATHEVLTTPARIERLRALDNRSAATAADLLEFTYQLEHNLHRDGGVPMHDPCTVAYLLAPQMFRTAPCRIAVETTSTLTLGHTAVEFRLDQAYGPLVEWAVHADGEAVFRLLTESLGRA